MFRLKVLFIIAFLVSAIPAKSYGSDTHVPDCEYTLTVDDGIGTCADKSEIGLPLSLIQSILGVGCDTCTTDFKEPAVELPGGRGDDNIKHYPADSGRTDTVEDINVHHIKYYIYALEKIVI